MRSRSAYDLIGDVRSRSDQQTLNGQVAYITDAEILEWLNQAWAELYDLLTKTGEHYYLKQQNFQSVNGVTSSNSTSVTSPLSTPPWMPAPIATTSSGFTP